ncbi:MAG TPA: hypothetical protein VNT79_02115 [Phycisphaerae bacterium]|nr:hypothetical protein [Phycisphaerae bacterium]
MAGPYIPSKTAERRVWLENFRDLIVADPNRYAITAGDATFIDQMVDDWIAAYLVANTPETRTPVSVAQFGVVQAMVMPTIRIYAQFIKANFAVTPEDKIALGLNLTNPSSVPIPAPSTVPLLSIIGATMGEHTVRYADQNTPNSRAKPFGAAMILVFANIAEAQDNNPDIARFIKVATVNPVGVQYAHDDNGKTATLFAKWVTRRGLEGPWSAPASFTIVS